MTLEGREREPLMLKECARSLRDVVGQNDHFSDFSRFCIFLVVLFGYGYDILLTKTNLFSFDRLHPANHHILKF